MTRKQTQRDNETQKADENQKDAEQQNQTQDTGEQSGVNAGQAEEVTANNQNTVQGTQTTDEDVEHAKQTQTVGDSDVPKGITDVPVHGTVVYQADATAHDTAYARAFTWVGTDAEHELLKAGVLHTDKAVAEFHGQALANAKL